MWDHIYKYITEVATIHNIEVQELRPHRVDDFVSFQFTASTGHRESLNSSESLKTNIYFPVLDHILSEIDPRFTQTNLDLMKSLQACHPSSSNFLEPSQLNPLVSLYSLSTYRLATECVLAKRTLQDKDLNTVIDVYWHILPLQTAFPTVKKILQIGLMLAVSTAQCERLFSALKRVSLI